MPIPRIAHLAAGAASLLVLVLAPARLLANAFLQTNLVSDMPGFAAFTDPNLINPWGVSHSGTSPTWVSDQGTGLATLYIGTGAPQALVVTIPGGTGPNAGPTGQVFNTTASSFGLSDGAKATFLFANLNGTISGWNGAAGTTALNAVTTTGASYTGLALASVSSANYLYATNVNGTVRVFDSSFADVTGTTFSGKFVDSTLPAGFFPYNVQLIGSNLYVVYATFDAMGNEKPGGYVDEYDTSGNFIRRVAGGSPLDGPWGIALAPSTFGDFGNDFLVGNVASGQIDAFSQTGLFLGALDSPGGSPIVNDALWSLDFRTGGTGFNTNALYITAGLSDEEHGLYAEILPTPEPSPLILVGMGLLALTAFRLRPHQA